MKKIIILFALFMLCWPLALAQTTGNDCIGFSSSIEGTQIELDAGQKSALKSKIDQMITRNKVPTTTLYNAFIITPQISIISQESLTSGVRPVNTVIAELMLVASNSIDNSVYGSIAVEIKASANSEKQVLSAVINSIRPADVRFTKFIRAAVTQISDYYTMNMPTVIKKVEIMIAASQYQEAIVFLESIPTCVPAYEQSSSVIQALHKQLADKDCYVAVTQAQRHISFGEYDQAKELLMGVKVGSDCDEQVTELLKQVSDSVKAVNNEKLISDTVITDEVVAAPQPTPTAQVAPTAPDASKPAATQGTIKSSVPNFDITLVEVTPNAANNTVELVFMVKNVTELSQKFYCNPYYKDRTNLYNSSGDTFYCVESSDLNFTLSSGAPRKISIQFGRVPASNKSLSGIITLNEGNIKIENINIPW